MDPDKAILLDIDRAARLVEEFICGLDKPTFLEDLKTQSAVLHQLMVMGEAVKRLSQGFRNSHTEVPWALIAGMRDKLIHGIVQWCTLKSEKWPPFNPACGN